MSEWIKLKEKVIKALECRKNADKRCGNPCEETGICHYAKAVRDINGEIYRPFICDRERICTDALALLKEQEPITDRMRNRICPNCGTILKGRYCHECGQAVKFQQ